MMFSLLYRPVYACRLLAVASFLGLTGLAQESVSPVPQPGATVAGSFNLVHTKTNRLGYLLYVPKDYLLDTSKRFPMVLFLHGSGERGTNVEAVAVHGPPKQVKSGHEFPFILVSPQCPNGERWEPETLMALVGEMEQRLRVDTHSEYVTGLSMGGYGTWALGVRYPEHFAAIAPICGGGERIDVILGGRKAEALKTLAVWAFHGAKDNAVPLEESQRMVSAFQKAGTTEVKLTVYPDAGHDAWTQAYNEPEFYPWLLQHHR